MDCKGGEGRWGSCEGWEGQVGVYQEATAGACWSYTYFSEEDGGLVQGSVETLDRWHQLLNQESEYREDVIEQMPESAPYHDLDEPPTEEELQLALTQMKRGIRQEGSQSCMVLFGGAVLWDRLLELMRALWREGEVVTDMKDAVI